LFIDEFIDIFLFKEIFSPVFKIFSLIYLYYNYIMGTNFLEQSQGRGLSSQKLGGGAGEGFILFITFFHNFKNCLLLKIYIVK
jgi:hypothetical protein